MTPEKLAAIRDALQNGCGVFPADSLDFSGCCSDLLAEVDRLTAENARLLNDFSYLRAASGLIVARTADPDATTDQLFDAMHRWQDACKWQKYPPEATRDAGAAPNAPEAAAVPRRDADAVGGEG